MVIKTMVTVSIGGNIHSLITIMLEWLTANISINSVLALTGIICAHAVVLSTLHTA